MTAGFSRDEQIRLLRLQYGVSDSRAKVLLEVRENITQEAPRPTPAPRPAIPFPLRFTVPWTALVSENRRFCAHTHRIFMTEEYKLARGKIKALVRGIVGDAEAVAIPLALTASVYFPDKRIHDAPNFAGATHNALKGVVYVDDQWLHSATWRRAGVDPDRPRAEIEIHPIPEQP